MRNAMSLASAAAFALLTVSLPGQLARGHSLCTVAIGTTTSELYDVDHAGQIAKKLTISSTLANSICNTITMTSPVVGYIGTNAPTTSTVLRGEIYEIKYIGGKITEKLVTNDSTARAAGNNIAQIVAVGSTLYFVSQGGAGGGVLQSVPSGGGKVSVVHDWKTGGTELVNGLCRLGNVLYASTFNSATSPTTGGGLLAYDLTTKKGTRVMTLPKSKYKTTTVTYGTQVVSMQANPAQAGTVALMCVYGDLLIVDPANKKVVSHSFSGFGTAAAPTINLVNSFAYDPVSKDWLVGSRDSHVEQVSSGHSAERIVASVGSTAAGSVNGMAYLPYGSGSDVSTGPGCPGAGGYTITSVPMGEPKVGNKAFKLGLFGGFGKERYLLILGLRNPKLSLNALGAPGCVQQADILFLIGGTLSGLSANGRGFAVVPFGIPATAPKGVRVYRQWVMDTTLSTKVNAANFVVSNGRETLIQ